MVFAAFPARRAALALALAAATPSFAQTTTLHPIVVTATRTPVAADELVSDVTVIERADIEAAAGRTLPELLARLAGVQISANGGLGKSSNVFIRGTEARHAVLLVDGVRLGSATLGPPAWDNIPLEMIERIEVLKGPASALYGSDAAGGVVQVFLRQGRSGFHPFAAATAGSAGHLAVATGLQAGEGAWRYSLGAQRVHERGFSATNAHVPFGNFNPDRDPFTQEAVDGALRYDFGQAWSLDGGFLYSQGRSAFDDGPGRDARLALRDATAHLRVRGEVARGWHSELQASQARDTSDSIDAQFPGAFKTLQTQWTWQNQVASPIGQLLGGLEEREQRVESSTAYAVTHRTIHSAFAGVDGSAGAHSWQANLRHDRNSQFGASDTGFVGYGWRFAPAWRVHASHGTSFVAPSFNQLYFPGFGNPQLQPERGRNTDIGLDWTAAGHQLKLVRFDNRIRGFITSTTTPANIPRARIEGWTLGYEGAVRELLLRASFDWLDPRNAANGRLLPRRARRQATLGAEHALSGWKFGGSLLLVGERFDDAANTRRMGGYATTDVYAEWSPARDWTAQAKINNLADRHYETAFGYNQPGRSFYLTLRWAPR